MTKFSTSARFNSVSSEQLPPYKRQIATSKESDFDVKEPRGIKFGKDREPNTFVGGALFSSCSAKNIHLDSEFKPKGCLLGKRDVRKLVRRARIKTRHVHKESDRLMYDVTNMDNKWAYCEKPQEVDREIIEIVQDIQKFKSQKVKKMHAETGTDAERAGWADLLVPDSIRCSFKDDAYRKELRDAEARRQLMGYTQPTQEHNFNIESFMQNFGGSDQLQVKSKDDEGDSKLMDRLL